MLSLWLPILLSAVFVFVLSSVIHMAMPWHKSDFQKMPDEDKVRDALRPHAPPPGDYMVPMCDGGNYNSPEFKAKLEAGPNMLVTMLPNGCGSMGMTFVQWFLFLLAVSFMTAYVAWHALPQTAPFMTVLRIAGAVAFLAYAGAQWPQSIWYKRKWSTTVKCTFDALLYGLATGATFAWLWAR